MSGMNSDLKTRFEQGYASIEGRYRKGLSGLALSSELSVFFDEILVECWNSLAPLSNEELSLFGYGSYGRSDLCFASDLDILILHSHDNPVNTGLIETFLHHLLDLDIKVSHTVRTIPDSLQIYNQDFETWLALLEARFIVGNHALAESFFASLQEQIKHRAVKEMHERIIGFTGRRHKRYGDSVQLLEPNIKNSAGGLRDLHTTSWLAYTGWYSVHDRLSPNKRQSLDSFLRSDSLATLFDSAMISETRQAYDFLIRVRNHMHFFSRGLHDTLDFALQRQVAESMQYGSSENASGVELFMRDYYRAGKAVARFADHLQGYCEESFVWRLNESFRLQPLQIKMQQKGVRLSTTEVLNAFLLSLRYSAPLSHTIEDTILKHLDSYSSLQDPHETHLFRSLFESGPGVGRVLRRMNDIGILGIFMPEWEPLVAFYQHNVYHFYTVDEHTLKVIERIEELAHDKSAFGDIFRGHIRMSSLYLACLFHDIAKPISIQDHESIGAEIAENVMRRLGYDEPIIAEVSFLVRHHLEMEQVAFRRDLGDQATIADFADRFIHPEYLDALLLLTYGDLGAVNKSIWNEWKAGLLLDLHRRSKKYLYQHADENQGEQRDVMVFEKDRRLKQIVSSIGEGALADLVGKHLTSINSSSYINSFSDNEILEHARRLNELEGTLLHFIHFPQFSEVTILSRDMTSLLSSICGVLTSNDTNILDAAIFTRSDGMVVDKFRISDLLTGGPLSEQKVQKIESDLHQVLGGTLKVEKLLAKQSSRWKRKVAHINPYGKTDVEFEDHDLFLIIDVYAPDVPGVLYCVTHAISGMGLQIHFAKIASRADGIVDTFYVLDRNGCTITSHPERIEIKKSILSAMNAFLSPEN